MDDMVEKSRDELLNRIYDYTNDLRNSLEERSTSTVAPEDVIKLCQCVRALCVYVCTDGSLQEKEKLQREKL